MTTLVAHRLMLSHLRGVWLASLLCVLALVACAPVETAPSLPASPRPLATATAVSLSPLDPANPVQFVWKTQSGLRAVTGVGVDAQGNVFACDFATNTIHKF